VEFDSYRRVSAGQSHDQVEVAGIEPCSTIWNRRETLVPRTKSQEPSGPLGKNLNQQLTASTATWMAATNGPRGACDLVSRRGRGRS
jgi:hypothetical protein